MLARFFFILLLVVFVAKSLYADVFKVSLGDWPPYTDPNREDGGVSIEILRRALQSQGHDIETIQMPWARSLVMLERQEIDILPAVWFKEDRTETMLYSDAYAANRLVFIKAKGDDFEYTGEESLTDKVIGIIQDYVYDGKIIHNESLQFSPSYSLESNIKKVVAGRIDLTLDDEISVKEQLSPELLEQIEFVDNPLSEIPLYATCSKKNPKCPGIITAFNKGLKALSLSRVSR